MYVISIQLYKKEAYQVFNIQMYGNIQIQWKPSAKKKHTNNIKNRNQFDNLTGITRNESSACELYNS